MEGALKASANPFFKSKYADLKSVWEACRIPLATNGLSVVQSPRIRHGDDIMPEVAALAEAVRTRVAPVEVVVTTILMHQSGQWIENELSMWPKDNSPQAIGSCISYARRYALAAMVGVYQADDDAEAAHGRSGGDQDSTGPSNPDELQAQLTEVVTIIKAGDIGAARRIWTECNALGTTAAIWRVLNTKQKAALRDLLQATEKHVSGTEAPAQEAGDVTPTAEG